MRWVLREGGVVVSCPEYRKNRLIHKARAYAELKTVRQAGGTTTPADLPDCQETHMYIRRIRGPHSVTLPDGTIMTRADLPQPQTRRWVASRKAAVVRAVDHGLITEAEAQETWDLSSEELEAWRMAVVRHGVAALRATALQRYRDPKVDAGEK
jgi:hypothetical protein